MPDPDYRKVIEDSRKAGSILPSSFFKSDKAKAALYQLTKEDAATAAAKKAQNNPNAALDAEVARKKKAGLSIPGGFKKGGMVKKTGMALVHRGEKVLTKKQQAKKGQRKRA